MTVHRKFHFSRRRGQQTVERFIKDSLGENLLWQTSGAPAGRQTVVEGGECLNFGACSYMGLHLHPDLIEGTVDAVRRFGTQFPFSRVYLSSNWDSWAGRGARTFAGERSRRHNPFAQQGILGGRRCNRGIGPRIEADPPQLRRTDDLLRAHPGADVGSGGSLGQASSETGICGSPGRAHGQDPVYSKAGGGARNHSHCRGHITDIHASLRSPGASQGSSTRLLQCWLLRVPRSLSGRPHEQSRYPFQHFPHQRTRRHRSVAQQRGTSPVQRREGCSARRRCAGGGGPNRRLLEPRWRPRIRWEARGRRH